ncbi:MAG: class I SAM-dependent methyltransferase [bacterium]|nr:class I SAM-dependent methyltransferase [bacterium]
MEKPVYESMYLHEEDFWWFLGMRKISEIFLRNYIMPSVDNKILDAGCGGGGKFKMLSQYGKVYGIDISQEALKYSRLRNIAEVSYGSVEKIPMGNNEFNLVNCNDVLYHSEVGNDVLAMQEFARVLKPGGILFIREAAYDWLRGHNDKVVWVKHRYSKREIISKLEANGFEILRISYVNCFLFPIALIVRLFERAINRNDIPEDIYNPPFLLNSLFTRILNAEATVLSFMNLPFGLSIACVARKKKTV